MAGKDESSIYMATKLVGKHHRSLFEIAAIIEQYSLCEKRAGNIPDEAVTKINMVSFYEVGVRHGFATSIPLLLTVPFGFMVWAKLIPIFGKQAFTWYDTLFAFMLSMLPAVATSLFLFFFIFINLYQGNVTSKCMHALANGIALGKTLGCGISFALFHIIYFLVLKNPKTYHWILTEIPKWKLISPQINTQVAYRIAAFVYDLQGVFIQSAWFVVVIFVINLAIIYGGISYGKRRTNTIVNFKKRWLLE